MEAIAEDGIAPGVGQVRVVWPEIRGEIPNCRGSPTYFGEGRRIQVPPEGSAHMPRALVAGRHRYAAVPKLISVMARRAAPHCTGPSSSFESLLLSFGRSPIASHTVDLVCPPSMVPGLTSTSARTPTMMTLCLAWGIP